MEKLKPPNFYLNKPSLNALLNIIKILIFITKLPLYVYFR
jgi:hypothetical protein